MVAEIPNPPAPFPAREGGVEGGVERGVNYPPPRFGEGGRGERLLHG